MIVKLPCLMSGHCYCSVALPRGVMCVNMLFPDHTHLLWEAVAKIFFILLHYLERIASIKQMYINLIVMWHAKEF